MKLIYILLSALIFVSCDNNNAPIATPISPVFDVKVANTLIGQKLDVVQPALVSANIAFRVVEIDGAQFSVTLDFNPDRLNFSLKNGIIIAVSKG